MRIPSGGSFATSTAAVTAMRPVLTASLTSATPSRRTLRRRSSRRPETPAALPASSRTGPNGGGAGFANLDRSLIAAGLTLPHRRRGGLALHEHLAHHQPLRMRQVPPPHIGGDEPEAVRSGGELAGALDRASRDTVLRGEGFGRVRRLRCAGRSREGDLEVAELRGRLRGVADRRQVSLKLRDTSRLACAAVILRPLRPVVLPSQRQRERVRRQVPAASSGPPARAV